MHQIFDIEWNNKNEYNLNGCLIREPTQSENQNNNTNNNNQLYWIRNCTRSWANKEQAWMQMHDLCVAHILPEIQYQGKFAYMEINIHLIITIMESVCVCVPRCLKTMNCLQVTHQFFITYKTFTHAKVSQQLLTTGTVQLFGCQYCSISFSVCSAIVIIIPKIIII